METVFVPFYGSKRTATCGLCNKPSGGKAQYPADIYNAYSGSRQSYHLRRSTHSNTKSYDNCISRKQLILVHFVLSSLSLHPVCTLVFMLLSLSDLTFQVM